MGELDEMNSLIKEEDIGFITVTDEEIQEAVSNGEKFESIDRGYKVTLYYYQDKIYLTNIETL